MTTSHREGDEFLNPIQLGQAQPNSPPEALMVGAPVPDSTWRVRCLALDQPWEFDFSCREGFAGDIATSKTVHPRADQKLTHPHVRTACVRSAPVWRAEWQSRTRSPTRNATAAHMNAVIRYVSHMVLPFFSPAELVSGIAGPEEAKNRAGRRQSSARFESV